MSKYWYDVLAVEESAPFGFCPCCGKAFDGELIDFYEIKFCPFCGIDLSVNIVNTCKIGSMVNYILGNYFVFNNYVVNDKIPATDKAKYINSIDKYTIPYIIGVLLVKFYNDNKKVLQYFVLNNYFIRRIKENTFSIGFFDNTNYYYICTIILKEDNYLIKKEV